MGGLGLKDVSWGGGWFQSGASSTRQTGVMVQLQQMTYIVLY